MTKGTNEPKRNWGRRTEEALGVVVGIGLLWLFLLFAVSLGLAIFWPSPYYTLSQFSSIASALTIPIAATTMLGYRWVRRVPASRCSVLGNEDAAISPIIADFRVRSGLYRIAAVALFILLATATIAGFFLVSTPARERANYHEALPGQLPALIGPLIATEEQRAALTKPEVTELLTVILDRSTYPTWGEVIGAVTLWIVLVQVIASLFRYLVRLASFYDSRADYLQLRGTADADDWREVLDMVDPGPLGSEGWVREFMRMLGRGPKTET